MGPLRLWTPVVLAPMAGVTDVPFRRLCRIMGESGLPDHLRPTGIPSWAAESGEGATASYLCQLLEVVSTPPSTTRSSGVAASP